MNKTIFMADNTTILNKSVYHLFINYLSTALRLLAVLVQIGFSNQFKLVL
ncbi:hypothetical protein ACVET5_000980 [Listeria monocytogenes]|nr:hypothetical protein [Listeria monocytogenes]EIM0799685.1 hypothetical protein [Listeria monocytogenes]